MFDEEVGDRDVGFPSLGGWTSVSDIQNFAGRQRGPRRVVACKRCGHGGSST